MQKTTKIRDAKNTRLCNCLKGVQEKFAEKSEQLRKKGDDATRIDSLLSLNGNDCARSYATNPNRSHAYNK